jgi:adenosylcobinamide kinase/adenosylcobinamide-phosphate guanylyltransferase
MGNITLVTGGARSGKSTHALALAAKYQRKFFLATGEARDEEMAQRIEYHRATRPAEFQTIEEPVNLFPEMRKLAGRADLLVLDCLTLWVSNLMHSQQSDSTIMLESDRLAEILQQAAFASIVVTDEVGWGIVPEHPMARRYRDLLGWTNQKIAAVADQVLLMVSGFPVKVK